MDDLNLYRSTAQRVIIRDVGGRRSTLIPERAVPRLARRCRDRRAVEGNIRSWGEYLKIERAVHDRTVSHADRYDLGGPGGIGF